MGWDRRVFFSFAVCLGLPLLERTLLSRLVRDYSFGIPVHAGGMLKQVACGGGERAGSCVVWAVKVERSMVGSP